MNPLVSLVSPVYNAMPWLESFLDCMVQQTWRPLEVILVEDGSTDASRECLLRRRGELEDAGIAVRLVLKEHAGQAAAFNAALPLVSGEFFTWCDSDDLLTPDSIEKKVLWLLAHPDVGMVRSNGIVLDADKDEVLSESTRECDRHDQDIFEDLFLGRTYCYAGCYMVRSDLFFACYPQRRIPESPEGQNLQLLLPPASRTVCGYVDEKLHTYCRRSSGHSSMKRSYRENLRRIANFTTLRLEILEYCHCDRALYAQKARETEENDRKILLYSAVQRARKELGT